MKKEVKKTLIFIITIILVVVILSLKPFYLFKRARYKIDKSKENITTSITLNEGYIYENEFSLGEYYYFENDNCFVNEVSSKNGVCTININNLKEGSFITIEGVLYNTFDDVIATINDDMLDSTYEIIDTDLFYKDPYVTNKYRIVIKYEQIKPNQKNEIQIISGNISKTIEIYFKK